MSNILSIENYVHLTNKTKIIRPGRFFIQKLKLSENDPVTTSVYRNDVEVIFINYLNLY